MLSSLRFETLLMRLNGDMRGNLFDRESEFAPVDLETADGIESDTMIEEGKEEEETDEDH